jgi:hypothetical protein
MTLSGSRPERWPSGRRRSPAKGVYPEGYRGFESHLLRHLPQRRFSRQFDDHRSARLRARSSAQFILIGITRRIVSVASTDSWPLRSTELSPGYRAVRCYSLPIGRIWRKTGSNVAHLPRERGTSLRLSSGKTSVFLTKYKQTRRPRVAFVTFQQQRIRKAIANTPNRQVGDCVTGRVLYFQLRKQGRLIVQLLETR